MTKFLCVIAWVWFISFCRAIVLFVMDPGSFERFAFLVGHIGIVAIGGLGLGVAGITYKLWRLK